MLQKSSMWLTLEVFFLNPSKEHYLMDISRKIGIAHTSVKGYLRDFVGLGIVLERIDKKGKRKFPVYKANINDKSFKMHKMEYNFSSILESGIVGFLREKLMPGAIVLFGSYRRGEDIEESDIDIFLECKKENVNVERFEKKLGRKIQLHFQENFNAYPKELKNNIINGIVLSGFLEGYK